MARGHGHATSSLKKLDHVEYIWLEGMNPTEASALKIKSIFRVWLEAQRQWLIARLLCVYLGIAILVDGPDWLYDRLKNNIPPQSDLGGLA